VELPADPRALPALYQISTLACRRELPRDVLRAILKIVVETLGATSGDVSLLNPDTGKLEIELTQEIDDNKSDDLSLRLGQGITGWVAFHGRPQLVTDVTRDPRYVRIRDHVKTEMVTPLIGSNGHVMGVINIDGDRIEQFSPADLALMIALTAEATTVMERHWELKNLRGKANQLGSLISIGQTLVTKLEPQDLFNSITRDAREITGNHACALYLHDPESRTARIVAYDGPADSRVPHVTLPLDSCLVASVIHTHKTIEYANVQSLEYVDVIDLPQDPSLRSALACPLQIEHDVLGVIVVFTDHVHRFNNDEKRLLGALASLGVVALQNARLYARVFQSEATLRKNEQLITLGLLAAEIAHEIRNPLTVLKLLFSTLNLDYPDSDPRRTDARVITEKLDQLEAIVSRVLNFAKAPSNLHSRWNVAEIINDTLVLIRLKLTQGKIQLHFSPPHHALIVDVHKGQLQQVLLNLFLNASQAMPEGGDISVNLTETHTEDAGPMLRIEVSDTGPGIPASMQDRIFDSFLSGRPDGSGLGLSIAKRILVGHHGDIILDRTGPDGTTMTIILPIA